MIQVTHINTYNFDNAVRGMRNPLQSWEKSDSKYFYADGMKRFAIGDNDIELMHRLYKAGTEHRKFLRQIFISMDITAPVYWWAELDTYKVGVTRNSCSFMHRGIKKPFEINDFSTHSDEVYHILNPISRTLHSLKYPYECDRYKQYVCANGRKYKVYANGKIIAESFDYVDTKNRHRVFEEREVLPTQTNTGYYVVRLGGRNGEAWLLHRLIATVWIPNPDNLYTVNHIDGDKGNNSVDNLEWCSLHDNIKKGFRDGLFENGKSLHTKYLRWKRGHILVDPFTKSQILRDYSLEGLKATQISQKYDITIKQANNIIHIPHSEYQDLFMQCYYWETVINALNDLRERYLDTEDDTLFQQIRCLLPSGYNQLSTVTMNYENAITMINQRENHKLQEWKTFTDILKKLPYMPEIRGEM